VVVLLFNQKSEFQHELSAADQGKRYQISALLSEKFSQRKNARELNISPSTVR